MLVVAVGLPSLPQQVTALFRHLCCSCILALGQFPTTQPCPGYRSVLLHSNKSYCDFLPSCTAFSRIHFRKWKKAFCRLTHTAVGLFKLFCNYKPIGGDYFRGWFQYVSGLIQSGLNYEGQQKNKLKSQKDKDLNSIPTFNTTLLRLGFETQAL